MFIIFIYFSFLENMKKGTRDTEERLRQSKVYLIAIPQRFNIGNGGKSIYREMKAKNFPTLLKHKISQK